MTTILILSCGTRNKLVRFFKEAFHSLPGGGRVIVTDCSPWAPALYEADAFYLVPPMKDPGYEDRILEICMREQVNALLPLFEDELDLLAQNRKKFEEKGITAIVSDAESVAVCRDKYGFFSLLQKNGVSLGVRGRKDCVPGICKACSGLWKRRYQPGGQPRASWCAVPL